MQIISVQYSLRYSLHFAISASFLKSSSARLSSLTIMYYYPTGLVYLLVMYPSTPYRLSSLWPRNQRCVHCSMYILPYLIQHHLQVLCPCNCKKYVNRRTMRRHLNGQGAKDVLVAQQTNIRMQCTRRRILFHRERLLNDQHISQGSRELTPPIQHSSPPPSPPLQASGRTSPFSPDQALPGQSEQIEIDPHGYSQSIGSGGTVLSHCQGIWPSDLSRLNAINDEDRDEDENGEWEDSDNELGRMGLGMDEEDEDIFEDDFEGSPWQQGLTALERLQEEFERSAASRGELFALLISIAC